MLEGIEAWTVLCVYNAKNRMGGVKMLGGLVASQRVSERSRRGDIIIGM